MAVDKFKFLSPGIQVNEIDESRVESATVDTGPVIIGRTAYGPAMTPVQVSTVAELNRVFGEAYNGKGIGSDVWRDGNKTAPTYATYAAEAFLRNSSPVTVIRTLGAEHVSKTTGGEAGWKLAQNLTATTANGSGAWGLFVWPWDGVTGSAAALSGTYQTGSLAAIIYTSGSVPYLMGVTGANGTENTVTGTLVFGVTENSTATVKNAFKLKISGSTSDEKVISFNQDSANFIRKTLNTNPTRILSSINVAASRETYFLGETYEGYINDTYGTSLNLAAAIIPLATNSSNFQGGNKPSKSGWIVANHDGPSTSFSANANGVYPVTNLFRFVTLNGGTWEQSNLKISIENIRVSPNQGVDPYPRFDVAIRNLFDDSVLERYNGVNLDVNSDNYICKVIGDSYFEWSYSEERNVQYGEYPNASSRIRIEMSGENITPSMIPFGFYGPVVAVSASNAKTSTGDYYGAGSITGVTSIATLPLASHSIPLRSSNGTKALKNTRWGIDELSLNVDKNYVDMVRRLSNVAVTSDSYAYEPSGSATKYSFMFSLDNIALTGSSNNKGLYAETYRSGGTSYSAKNGANSVLDYFNSFDLPLFGGSEGVNILQKEPIVNNSLLSSGDELSNYAYNTVDVAIKMIADPELFETDVIVVPGLTNTTLTDRLINLCEERADSIALIDIENDYKPVHEGTAEVQPVVATAISSLKARKIDSSYAAAYYPAVYDASAGIFLPASIAALGVMGGTEGRSALWFAPAGFNRGGLNRTNSGLNVSRAAVALTSKQRDDMYVSNINPIATFPREGVVIFGQKTLQATPSALDRVNVRRLMNYVKRQISRASTLVLFEPNVEATWNNFKGIVEPFLLSVKNAFGLDDFRVVLDSRTTTADLVDRNIMYAKIILKPTKAIEFIALDFVITNTGAVFTEQ